MTIINKNELYSYFDDKMNKSYKDYKKNSKSGYENTLLKTYIIESNFQGSVGKYHDNVVCGINEIIGNNKNGLKLTESKDEDLLILSGNGLNLYMELYNKRFWFIHTMNKSTQADNFIKFILKYPKVDRFWIPSGMFKRISEKNDVYGISVHFQDSFNSNLFFNNEQQEFSFNAQKGDVKDLMDLFGSSTTFRNKVAINKLSILQSDNNEDFIIDDIKHDGKVTAKGNSIEKHNENLAEITEDYNKVIYYVEEKMGLHFDESGLKGTPIEILFSRDNLGLEKLVDLIFSPGSVFRLWGIPEWANDSYVRVQAVDLHSGNKGRRINFELTSKFIRVYLPEGTCGNSVMRLLTNINCYVDALAMVRGFDIDDLFTII